MSRSYSLARVVCALFPVLKYLICKRIACGVFLSSLTILLLQPAIFADEDTASGASETDRLRQRVSELDGQIAEARAEQAQATAELSELSREVYEARNRTPSDPELRALRAELVEAEKRYRKLLAEYRKRFGESSEVKESDEKRQECIERVAAAKKRYRSLKHERDRLKRKLQELKKVEESN